MKYNAALALGLASMVSSKPVNGGPGLTTRESSAKAGSNQQIALASYIPPRSVDAWDTLLAYDSSKLSVIVANVLNGPDVVVDTRWKDIIQSGRRSGKTVLGYVRTGWLGYLLGSLKKVKTTRKGSNALADWVGQIERDIDMWYSLYGDDIGGIFFDEGYNICDSNHVEEVLAYLDRYTKLKHPGAFTVINPGAPMGECFKDTMDTLITFEHDFVNYNSTTWEGNNWTEPPKDKRKIWHIVYETPESEIQYVAELALKRGAGLLHVTGDTYPNPYDELPSDSYMKKQLAAVDGGSPLRYEKTWPDGGAAATPSKLTAATIHEDSVQLSWSKATNALGYQIYQDGKLVASILNSMTTVLVSELQPNTAYTFTVTAVGGKGAESSPSSSVAVQTKALLGNKTIVNLSSTKSGDDLVLKADSLLGYGKYKLFLWDQLDCDPTKEAAWVVALGNGHSVCTRYLFEGDAFYSYDGPAGSQAYKWKLITAYGYDEQPLVLGNARTWTFPLANLTEYPTATKVAVEGSGYYPTAVAAQDS